MKLSGPQFEQLQAALLDAYTEFGLRQMVRVQMDVDLDRVAGGRDLDELTFNLIRWAEQRGQVPRLIEAAYDGNQENPQLAGLIIDAQCWFADRDETPPPLNDLAPVPPQTAHQIFLSYSRKDSRYMQQVHRALTDAGGEYDGSFTITGPASPGDEVENLLDEAAVGLTRADDAGRWTHRLTIDAPGRHVISVNVIIGELRRPGSARPVAVMIAPTLAPTNTPTQTPTRTPVPPTLTPTNTPTAKVTPTPETATVREIGGVSFCLCACG